MRTAIQKTILSSVLLFACSLSYAQDSSDQPTSSQRNSSEIINLAWKSSHEGDIKTLNILVNEMIAVYGLKAKEQASQLTAFPGKDQIENYKIMNDVATSLFVKAEALMRQGKNDESKAVFNSIIQEYPWSQSWDPSRGSYWSVKEKSQLSMDVMSGIAPKEPEPLKQGPPSMPTLAFPGQTKVIDYKKFGQFTNEGTKNYHYQITDRKGLIAAIGEGIYPNIADIYKDPNYKKLLKEGRLEGSHWDFINTPDLQAALYKWIVAPEPDGVKLFYMGIIFEKAKMYYEAVKCYHAIIVHFPEIQAWTYWHTPWYPSQAAIAKIQHIIRMHPELKLDFKGAKIRIMNSFDNDPVNDITITTPGEVRLLGVFSPAASKQKGALGKVVKSLGQGKVRLVQHTNGHWQMMVNNKPFLIKGITYGPTMIGQSPDNGTLSNWMTDDFNRNGKIDGPYEAWMDKNNNNKQDADEPTVGDFALMKEMGVNTLRIYNQASKPVSKELLQKMHKDYGFMVLMANHVGKYAIGSGASWSEGTDYENPVHQKNMMESVKQMVMEFKDKPYILMWLLGNENNYGVASNADKKPEAYYKFVNEVALMIKSIDPNHPVAICNGDILFLDKFAKLAPDIDAYGANVYRGDYGFGSYWQQIAEVTGKPAFITEYGAPAYSGPTINPKESLELQAAYHKGNWLDIFYNSARFVEGEGNSIGGVAFEWVDEWWKNYEPARHDTKADVVGPFPGGFYYEEWFGLLGQGNGKNSPYMREPRKVYSTYKSLWNSKE